MISCDELMSPIGFRAENTISEFLIDCNVLYLISYDVPRSVLVRLSGVEVSFSDLNPGVSNHKIVCFFGRSQQTLCFCRF